MTVDLAVALSLVPDLSRTGLGARLRADDPFLLERAEPLLARARALRESAAVRGVQVVAWNDPRYPAALLATPDFPPALWFRGRLEACTALAVAIVGSRAASAVALETASRLGGDLAARGVTVVSGLARGVDSAAHRGALAHGLTVAVLGSGPDIIYPREHTSLADDIAREGAVVSEYAPGTPPRAFHFPHRNRIISGLSRAVVVVEAGEGSGSLITAACALDQGREVMAVPGNVLSGRNRGAHALLRDGARIVECADDVLEELGLCLLPTATTDESHAGSAAADPLVRAMAPGQPYDLQDLTAATGIDAVRLLPRLLQLELQGLVHRIEGARFIRSA
jgi:DNA processing protein